MVCRILICSVAFLGSYLDLESPQHHEHKRGPKGRHFGYFGGPGTVKPHRGEILQEPSSSSQEAGFTSPQVRGADYGMRTPKDQHTPNTL